MDQLPRLGKRELICLLSFTCNYVVFVWRGFLFLWVLGMGYVILLWHSLSLPYNYFEPTPTSTAAPSNTETTVIPSRPLRSLKKELYIYADYVKARSRGSKSFERIDLAATK